MPKTTDFKSAHKKQVKKNEKNLDTSGKQEEISTKSTAHGNLNQVNKRRPGREASEASESPYKVVDVDVAQKESVMEAQEQMPKTQKAQQATPPPQSEPHPEPAPQAQPSPGAESAAQPPPPPPKIEISFPGSEVIRAKFPLPFDVAEVVATDWINNGNFESLPVKHPLGKTLAQKGLLKAKELEQKVMASPVTEKATMAAFEYAVKAQSLINEIKAKVNKKN